MILYLNLDIATELELNMEATQLNIAMNIYTITLVSDYLFKLIMSPKSSQQIDLPSFRLNDH